MKTRLLDDFTDLSGWTTVASGQARLAITPEQGPRGRVMRLDFDFRGGGGFVVARRPFELSLPESYAFSFELCGEAPPNKLEFKLVDPSGVNVWRYQQEAFEFGPDWRRLSIPSRDIEFAWGPAGGGAARDVGALELVVAAGPGGRGTVRVADLRLEERTPSEPPLISASSALPGHEPGFAMDGRAATSWRAAASDRRARLLIDFRQEREYGGLVLHWTDSPRDRAFAVDASDDGDHWRTIYRAPASAGGRSFVYLPRGTSRFLRLEVAPLSGDEAPGVVSLEVRPYEFSRSLNDFFHQVAEAGEPGRYPKWLYRRQSYWTPVDIPEGRVPALLNEEGLLEVGRGSFTLEPFLYFDNRLVTWADCEITQCLERDSLPIPSAIWNGDGWVLTITAFAGGEPGDALLQARYRLENRGPRPLTARLFVAVRPFQVSPPWQAWEDLGGVSAVRDIRFDEGALWVNGNRAVVPLRTPAEVGAAAFDQGPVTDYLARGSVPAASEVSDAFGYASAALGFDLELAPGAGDDTFLAIPFGADLSAAARQPPDASGRGRVTPEEGKRRFEQALSQWADVLAGVRFELPAVAQDYARTCASATAHVLINRDGPALQPGPRRYTRSWIRDGAIMAAALTRMGRAADAEAFVRWYARFQAADGNVPCCVDRKVPDWLAEHDSHGELIFAIADHYRFTGDPRLVGDLWPQVHRAVGYLERLRAERLTPEYRAPDKSACFGLLPESVSHEGYLAHPVHAYWDDFWALRGLKDAAELAGVVGDRAESARLTALSQDFRGTLLSSLERTMTTRGIDFLPGSVEWADADPTAVANALTVIDEADSLPAAALTSTFDRFMARFRAMHGENPVDWTNYTPYEIRIAGALVRLGRRSEAHELLRFFLAERRPPAWNQWPEIAWRDPDTPGHQGDLPHAWIGAEYVLVFRDLFAFERGSDRSLVVCAGIPGEWLDAGDIAVSGLPTWYGRLDLRLSRGEGGALKLRLGGVLRPPPGGIVWVPPDDRTLREVRVNGRPIPDFNAAEVRIADAPAEVDALV